VQGLTEFLPISSSGHLRIVSEIFFGDDAGAAFTAVTQLGTEVAVLIYFARDIGHLVATWFRGFGLAQVRATPDYRIAWLVIIGTIPIGILGVLFEHQIQTSGRNLWIIGSTLIVFGLVLGTAEYYGRQRRPLPQLTVTDGVVMGLAQAMALVPGVSRSGGTISAGLFLGLTRPTAVRYSFLLAIPAVLAAGLFQIPDVFAVGGPGLQPSVERHSVYLFVWYRVVLGIVLLALLATGTISAT
jgi:undecaprenyl-diphosphatase